MAGRMRERDEKGGAVMQTSGLEPETTHTNSHSLPPPQARMAMADVYLRHRKDKTSYIKCYLDLVVRGMGGGHAEIGAGTRGGCPCL